MKWLNQQATEGENPLEESTGSFQGLDRDDDLKVARKPSERNGINKLVKKEEHCCENFRR